MQNIAEIMGLSARLIPFDNKKIPSDNPSIDWTSVYGRLKKLRDKSQTFINESIIIYCN